MNKELIEAINLEKENNISKDVLLKRSKFSADSIQKQL